MQAILNLIENSQPLKKWSERSLLKNKLAFLRKVITILNFISGDDLNSMLKDFFRYHFSIYLPSLTRERLALERIVKRLNVRIKPKNKHYFLRSIRQSGFSFGETKKLGFKFSKFLWNSCLNNRERNLGGRPGLPENLKLGITKHLENNSAPSSYRTSTQIRKKNILKKKNEVKVLPKPRSYREKVNCRFLNNNISKLQRTFPLNKTILWRAKKTKFRRPAIRRLYPSKRSFFRHKASFFKRARNKLDMCEYCEIGIALEKKIDKFIKERRPQFYQEEFNLNKYLVDFGNRVIETENLAYPEGEESDDEDIVETTLYDAETNENNVSEQLKLLKQIEYHKYVSDRIRQSYLLFTRQPEFYNETIFIEFDYKQVKNLIHIIFFFRL